MRCEFADSLLQGYFDGELSGPTAAEFERHLQQCAGCALEMVEMDLLSDQLRLGQFWEPAPAGLRRKVREDILKVAPTTVESKPRLWHWLAAAAALLLMALAGWKMNPQIRSEDYQAEFAEEIVEAHQRSLQPGHTTGIASNDEQTVKNWFDGKLKFAPPVRDFAKDGFELQGARVDVVYGRTVAALVYARHGHLINVFLWSTRAPDTAPHSGSRQGFQWVDWRMSKMGFCAVSDGDSADLEQLRHLLAG